jgi:hypothetical protein
LLCILELRTDPAAGYVFLPFRLPVLREKFKTMVFRELLQLNEGIICDLLTLRKKQEAELLLIKKSRDAYAEEICKLKCKVFF